jgi:hypothetical protein
MSDSVYAMASKEECIKLVTTIDSELRAWDEAGKNELAFSQLMNNHLESFAKIMNSSSRKN